MSENQSAGSQLFMFAILVALVGISIAAYFNWYNQKRAGLEEPVEQFSDEELKNELDEYLASNESDLGIGEDVTPQEEILFSDENFYVVAGTDELSYIQVISKAAPALFDLSTAIPDNRLTSVDINADANLIAYTNRIADGLVSGLYLLNTETLEKRLLSENLKNQRLVSNVRFSPSGELLLFIVSEDGNDSMVVFSIEKNSFKTVELVEEFGSLKNAQWTNQNRLIVTTEKKILQSISRDEPHKLEDLSLPGVAVEEVLAVQKSPKENILSLEVQKIVEASGELQSQKSLIVYNVDAQAIVAEHLVSEESGYVWSPDGKAIFLQGDSGVVVLKRDEQFAFPVDLLLAELGAPIIFFEKEGVLGLRKDFTSADETVSRIELWDIEKKAKIFSTEPIQFVELF